MCSGHFAAAVFDGAKCLAHKTSHRYTTRRKAGGAQSSADNRGGAHKSAGAMLRRYNEKALNDEVKACVLEWRQRLCECDLVFLSASARSVGLFYAGAKEAAGAGKGQKEAAPFFKGDPRVRSLPFATGRPTLEELTNAHTRMATVVFLPWAEEERRAQEEAEGRRQREAEARGKREASELAKQRKLEQQEQQRRQQQGLSQPTQAAEAPAAPLSALYLSCCAGPLAGQAGGGGVEEGGDGAGDGSGGGGGAGISAAAALDAVSQLMSELVVDCVAAPIQEGEGEGEGGLSGADLATAAALRAAFGERDGEGLTMLHQAAQRGMALVVALLLERGADPTTLDWRGRPAAFVARGEKATMELRLFAGRHPELWDWAKAGVREPVTEGALEAKKEREKEKNRAKKARQKAKKKEQSAAAAEAGAKLAVEEKRVAEEKAQCCRALWGTPAHKQATHFPFSRLDFFYCSAKCVNDHKRVLMAEAAEARFNPVARATGRMN